MKSSAERARLKHKYRRLILTGRLKLPLAPAARLIGPDCAFHLYRSLPEDTPREQVQEDSPKRSRKKREPAE